MFTLHRAPFVLIIRCHLIVVVILLIGLCLRAAAQEVVQTGHECLCQTLAPDPFTPEARSKAADLLKQMTLEEKIGQMNMLFGPIVPSVKVDENEVRRGQVGALLFVTEPKAINHLQHIAVDESRLHIPLMFGFDVIHGYRTIFPVPLALAATWDMPLITRMQAAAAQEARAVGIDWTFAPMVDIARDARWGRIVEGAGEDPFLGASVARAQVVGFQGAKVGTPQHLLATVKHFAAYGAAEGGRDYDSVYLPDVLLHNVYFPPYKEGIDAGAAVVMSSYQDLNDIPATGNEFLLRQILRNEWGFKGFVVSDSGAVHDLKVHGFARSPEDAAFRAVDAGVNMEMSMPQLNSTYSPYLAGLVRESKVSIDTIDAAVLPILAAKFQMGLFDHPYVDESKIESILDSPEHKRLARLGAACSFVLLRNEGQILPLKKTIKSVAVIGVLADSKTDILGSWAFEANRSLAVTILEGIRAKVPSARVEFVRGAELHRPDHGMDLPPYAPITEQSPAQLEQEIRKAVAIAARSDVAIVVVGEHENMSGENSSRASFDLPGSQEQMLEAVASAGKPVVLVLLSGRPLNINWASKHVAAILQAWYPGSEGGNAVSDVLFGDVNPSGKLPITWPRSAGQEPVYYAHNLTHFLETSPSFISRYWDQPSSQLYPFGFGLSYSQFDYSNLRLDKNVITKNEALHASIDVTNSGAVDGEDIVQLYVHQQAGTASRPVKQLKGFQKVRLAPGEKQTVRFTLRTEDVGYWNPQSRCWIVEHEAFDVWIGGDSSATAHGTFRIKP